MNGQKEKNIVIILLCTIFLLGGFIVYDKFLVKQDDKTIENNDKVDLENGNDKQNADSNNNKVDLENGNDKQNADSNNKESGDSNFNQSVNSPNTMTYYKSNDNKYTIILISYEKKPLNPKASSLNQRFMFIIDEYYNENEITGSYFVENNKLTFMFFAPAFQGDCSLVAPDSNYFSCNLPGGVPLQKREDGSSVATATVDYSEDKIIIGNLELIRQS